MRHVTWQAQVWASDAGHEVLQHVADRTAVLEQEVGDASRAVHHVSATFIQHSRAHEAAGFSFVRTVDFERFGRLRAEDFLARIAEALTHLLSMYRV